MIPEQQRVTAHEEVALTFVVDPQNVARTKVVLSRMGFKPEDAGYTLVQGMLVHWFTRVELEDIPPIEMMRKKDDLEDFLFQNRKNLHHMFSLFDSRVGDTV